MDKNLLNYIKENKKQGFSDDQIRKALLDAGWRKEDIDEGFKNISGPPVPKHKSKWLVPVIVVVGIVVVGLVAWGAYSIFKPAPAPEPEAECQKAEDCGIVQECGMTWECQEGKCYQLSKECPPPDPTANWKTYQNDKYDYEVKYPKDYLITENKTLSSIHIGPSENPYLYEINYVLNRSGQSVEDFIYNWPIVSRDDIRINKTIFVTKIKVDNREAWKIEGPFIGSMAGWQYGTEIYFKDSNDDVIYKASSNAGEESYKDKEVFNQILSTFKFLE